MSNNEINIGDLFPKKEEEKFITADTSVPSFIKEAAYSPDETMEQTIQKDWDRLVAGLSDFVLAEQLTERGLRDIGKPVAENYVEYFHDTLKDVKKNRKKAEQKLFKLIPRHSQLCACEFFDEVREQAEKEAEARERSMEEYPHAGIKKEASPAWTSPEARPGAQTNYEEALCAACKKPVEARKGVVMGDSLYCQPCHDAGASMPPNPSAPPKPAPESLPPVSTTTNPILKEAAAKWKEGQHLAAKHDGTEACVVYVNEEAKTYIVKVKGTMYPSYYSWEDGHATFDAKDTDETSDGKDARSRGL